MAAQIIQFRNYQRSRELARMHADIEERLTKLHEIANRLFDSLRADYERPGKNGPPAPGE